MCLMEVNCDDNSPESTLVPVAGSTVVEFKAQEKELYLMIIVSFGPSTKVWQAICQ